VDTAPVDTAPVDTGPWTRPPRLRPGDRVAVVAPAGRVPPVALDAGLVRLRQWGLDVVVGEHVRDRHPSLAYLAGTDADRAADLMAAWCDPGVAAVFAARGGYGALRLLDRLDLQALRAAGPKVFVGSSDLTALHRVLGPALGLVTLFGPMPATRPLASDEPAADHLRRTLFEPESARVLHQVPAVGGLQEPLVGGRARGPLVGGTLSLLVSSLGVPGVPEPPDGAIVLLEDVSEQPYRLDHFLTHLLLSGFLDRAAGIVLGSWLDCGPPEAVREVLADRLGRLGIPVAWELGFGHGPAAPTVPLGVVADLDADAGTLTMLEPALR
jgi:muramoyltetrapeptide carboxypeptidase